MFQIDDDMTIYITRGDIAYFSVMAENNGVKYKFQPGDVVRMKVTAKKDCTNVAFQKDFAVVKESEKVDILLTEEETKIGDVISKPVDYWYEIELNPYTNPQTIVGYDDDGAKIFKLFPEGKDLGPNTVPEDVPVVDNELSLTSDRPVQNQAITRAMTQLTEDIKATKESGTEAVTSLEAKTTEATNSVFKHVGELESDLAVERARINNLAVLKEGSTTGDAELADIRVGADGTVYESAGEAVRGQVSDLKSDLIQQYQEELTKGYEITLDITSIGTNNPIITDGSETTDFQYGWCDNTGALRYDGGEVISRLIEVYPNCNYLYTGYLSGSSSFAFYDLDKKFICAKSASELGGSTSISFITPNNCFYIRIGCMNYGLENLSLKYDGETKIKNTFPSNFADNTIVTMKNGKCTVVEASEFYSVNTPIDLSDDVKIMKAGIKVSTDGEYYFTKHIEKEFSYRQRVTFPKDIHSVNGEYEIFRFYDHSKEYSIRLAKAVTTVKTDYPVCPVPIYNVGIKVYGNDTLFSDMLIPDGWNKELLLGADAMSIRFKGDTTNTVNQDIRLSVDNDYIRIYHGTTDSDIVRFTKSTYPTMESLYNAIVSEVENGALSEFEVSFITLDNLVPNDIIECDVALVAEYYRDNDKTISEYDAFPFYFTTKESGKEYDIEVLYDYDCPERLQLLVNGYCFLHVATSDFSKRDVTFVIPNTNSGITTKEIDIKDISQSEYPLVRIFYAEGITDGTTANGIDTSRKCVTGLATVMKDNNKPFVNMVDIEKILDGSYKPRSKYLWHFAHDDSAVEVINNEAIRNAFISNGIYPSLAMEMDKTYADSTKAMLKASAALGFNYHIHTGTIKPNIGIGYLSYEELNTTVSEAVAKFVSEFGILPNIWDFHLITENYNVVRYLKNHGFRIIFGGNGTGGINSINRYRCKRWYFPDDRADWNEVSSKMKVYSNHDITW